MFQNKTEKSCSAIAAILWSASAFSAELPAEKSKYTLFHPTPRGLMREFNTDRPDKTESPYTVDAGHFQYEADIVHYFQDRAEDGTLSQLWSFNAMNLKVGLANDVDFQVIIPTYNYLRLSGAESSYRGYSDTFLRVKYNFFGNDNGATALGMMPFVRLPTATEGVGIKRADGGIIFPFSWTLSKEWGFGSMFVYSAARDLAHGGYHSELIVTAVMGHALPAHFEIFLELYSRTSTETGSPWVATLDSGLIYSVSENVRLDAGVNYGLTAAAIDYDPYLGLSFRI